MPILKIEILGSSLEISYDENELDKLNKLIENFKKRISEYPNIDRIGKFSLIFLLAIKLEDQNNECAICGTPFEDEYKAQIDHCHTSGRVRGLLCIECNWMLGKANDNPTILRNAAAYLEKN